MASQRATLSSVGIWLLLRVERLQAGQEGGQEVLEKPAGRNRALADSGSTSRENRATTTREEEEGLSQKGREGPRNVSTPSSSHPIASSPMYSSKMHLEMDESSAVQCAGIVVVLQESHGEPQALSKGSSWTRYVLARCGVRKEPQERRGSR